jgi:hypothetical protein
MGAECPGFPSHPPSAQNVAWVEGDRVYTMGAVYGVGTYALRPDGGIAGLKEKVELGLALQARFEAAKADPDPGRRAERLVALTPFVSKLSFYGRSDCVWEVSRCGKAAVPHLVSWEKEPKGEHQSTALYALCGLGDVGIDAVLKILDDETAYWKAVAANLKLGQTVRESPRPDPFQWRGPNRLHHVLQATRGMKLSAANQERLRNHAGLQELDKLLTTKPGMKPEKSDMVGAHEMLRDILAGKFQGDE